MTDLALRDRAQTRLRSVLSSTNDVEEYLQEAVRSAGEVTELPASYTLSTFLYEAPFTVATTDRDAWEADQIEFDTADGPCFEVLHQHSLLGGIDLRSERRWPVWAAVSNLLGFRSAAALGVELESGSKLVLNCYGTGQEFLDQTAVDRAQQFVEELALTVPLALRLADQAAVIAEQAAHIAHLEQALASRPVIDQALGVLMAQNRCTRDQAFGILRRASQNRNIKLRDIAAAIIERFTDHAPEPPPQFRRSSDQQQDRPRPA